MPKHALVLALCTAGSVGLHLGLLSAGTGGTPGTDHASAAPRVQALQHGTDRVQLRALAEAPAWPSTAVEATAHTLEPTPPAPSALPASSPALATFDLDQLPPPGAGPIRTTDPGTNDPSASLDTDASYWPRNLLTRPPIPQQSIDLLYPDQAPTGRFRAVLTLFIDEQGVVRRVRIDEADDSGLPPVLEDAARQTFLRSRFSPGEIDGQAIRSRVRIEVDYVTETLPDRRTDPAR